MTTPMLSPQAARSPLPAPSAQLLQFDEHVVDVEELERRLSTSRLAGLSSEAAARRQRERPRPNLLPLDADAGRGGLHELVRVLRDGAWVHTRAESLLPGDVIALREGQCVPADVRLLECHDMLVDQRALLGPRAGPEPRAARAASVFDRADAAAPPHLEARNVAFYGTTVARGRGTALVVRTGADTVLGAVSSALLQRRQQRRAAAASDSGAAGPDVPLAEALQAQFEGVRCRDGALPAAAARVSALVVEHADVVARAVASASVGARPATLLEREDPVLAGETAREELERELARQLLARAAAGSADAAALARALAACRRRAQDPDAPEAPASPRVPTLPASSPVAAPRVADPRRDRGAVLRFAALFGHPQSRFAAPLHARVSSCDAFVHFDDECGAHVVVLVGPAREVLSRCGQVRRGDSDGGDGSDDDALAPLETADLQRVQDVVMDLEARGETVVSVAELYLDPAVYPVGVEFDVDAVNFPTSNMCYLGSLGLVEKLAPEVVLMAAFARAADVRLLVATTTSEFPDDDEAAAALDDDDVDDDLDDDVISHIDKTQDRIDDLDDDGDDEHGGAHDERSSERDRRLRAVCRVPVRLREASTGAVVDETAVVFRSAALSVANTLRQWRRVLARRAVVVLDGCTPTHIDLLVETLQELGECVALVASGSANALALAAADVGFAVPADEPIDLGEEAADVVLGSATCPRSDAIRLIDAVKRAALAPSGHYDAPMSPSPRIAPLPSAARARAVVVNLLRESVSAGRLLGLSEADLKACFDAALAETPSLASATFSPRGGVVANAAIGFAVGPPSPSKFPPSAFRSAGARLGAVDDVAVSSI